MKSVTHLIRVCNYFCEDCGNFQTRKPLGGGDPGAKRPTLSLYIFFIFFFFLRFAVIIEKRYENRPIGKKG